MSEKMSLHPTCHTLIVCERAKQDKEGRWDLTALFMGVRAEAVPTAVEAVTLYGVISEWRGACTLELKLVRSLRDEAGEEVVYHTQFETQHDGPLEEKQFCFAMGSIRFEHEGDYFFQIEHESAILNSRRIVVVVA